MPELSKTARASQVKEVKEKHVETTEEAIAAIRLDRAAHIWPNCERIDKLLADYDSVKLQASLVPGLQASIQLKDEALAVLGAENKQMGERLKQIADAGPVINAQIDVAIEHQHELDRMADEGCPHV